MANTQGPEGNYDPAGSTQMFRAFVDEGQGSRQAAPARSGGPRAAVIVAVVVALALVLGGAFLALK